ncbi:Leishmanolysin M8 metalloprotease [Phytophthora megakarya]|uniref:Leishmanolysin M8 metalloprotease n=1 Tax=Phytophthora megakarya TaxID=4795 RepID=A0A225VXK4_9STRA|nr:Leishmanolysin M8 metalloprotease [Phytophthora megakarya]
MVGSQQQYGDSHPFDARNRMRKLAEEDATNFQTYEAATAEDAYQPIRITPYYDEATVGLLSEAKRKVIYKVIPDAIERFREALKVVPVQGKLAAQHTCKTQWLTTPPICKTFVQNEMCLEMPIPSDHFGATRYCSSCPKAGCVGGTCSYSDAQGVENTDFLLYVRSETTNYCGTRTLAYASSCQKDQYDRPTFGMANFCPSQISTADADYESQVATAMHEITHALGFSAQFFPYMRYPDGTPRTPRDANGRPPTYRTGTCPNGSPIDYYVEPSTNTVQHFTERGHVVAKMVTPNVAAFVKSHFGCDSVVGAEIEQQDDSGCLGSHWEERIFEPEYMTPVDSFRNVFSALTLAFFEDSGWYRANTEAAERLHFGANRGCDFATKKCLSRRTMKKCINPDTGMSVAADHYCTSNSAESCSVDATSRSVCTISNGKSIPKDYQYFAGAPSKGGDDYADFCPMNVGYVYGDCSNPDNLVFPGSTKVNILGESYCPNCKCTATTLRSSDSSNWIVNSRRQTGCYAMRCYDNGSNDVSKSIIGFTIPRSKSGDTVQVNCTTKGEKLSVPGFSGWITCPDPSIICASDSAYNFVDDSGTGTGGSTTGTGTANLRSTNAANGLRPEALWTILLTLIGYVVATVH